VNKQLLHAHLLRAELGIHNRSFPEVQAALDSIREELRRGEEKKEGKEHKQLPSHSSRFVARDFQDAYEQTDDLYRGLGME